MPDFLNLIRQNPYQLWLAVGVVFVLLTLITGVGRLMWPSLAAAAAAGVGLFDARIALTVELAIFGVLTLAFLLLSSRKHRARSTVVSGGARLLRNTKTANQHGTMDRTGRLVGRIGKTTSEFTNGVGRVWIEDCEWGADLESGDDLLSDTPVRVTRVSGGVRLQVQALNA